MTSIIFFGSSDYSIIILKKLLEIKSFNLLAVVSKADKPVGRDQTITANPVADFARKNNLNLLQPDEFDDNLRSKIYDLNPDLGLVVAYGPPYFTQEMIDIPKFKVVNIHPSHLPKYRGATPGPWQIINGETKSAVTFFQIDALPDHGPIISQIPFEITPQEDSVSFYQKAFAIAADNLETVLNSYIYDLQSTTNHLIPQDHDQKTYFPKFTKDSAKIDWSWDVKKIERLIRALNPWPIAWTYVKNQQNQTLKMKIISSKIVNNNLVPNQVQIEGKKITLWEEIQKHYQLIKQ
jgi:methionyl-tRNA formyltransferase